MRDLHVQSHQSSSHHTTHSHDIHTHTHTHSFNFSLTPFYLESLSLTLSIHLSLYCFLITLHLIRLHSVFSLCSHLTIFILLCSQSLTTLIRIVTHRIPLSILYLIVFLLLERPIILILIGAEHSSSLCFQPSLLSQQAEYELLNHFHHFFFSRALIISIFT